MPIILISILLSYVIFIYNIKKYQSPNKEVAFQSFQQSYTKLVGISLIAGIGLDIFFHSFYLSRAISYFLILTITVMIVSYIFHKFPSKNRSQANLAYKIAISCAHLFILLNHYDHIGMGGYPNHSLDIFELLINSTLLAGGTIVLSLGLKGIFIIIHKFSHQQNKRRYVGNKSATTSAWSWLNHRHKQGSQNMKQHYQDHGMTPEEITYFRSQMAQAKDHILQIQENFPKTAKLRAIETRHKSIVTLQTYFKDIVQNPTRLTDASHFLCNILPSLDDLIQKYNEIQGHIAKNKQTYQILDRTATTIEHLCEEISQSYINFHSKVYKELEDELTFAQQNLQHVQSQEDVSMEDILDQDLNPSNEETSPSETDSSQD